jgi:hypothetical protein
MITEVEAVVETALTPKPVLEPLESSSGHIPLEIAAQNTLENAKNAEPLPEIPQSVNKTLETDQIAPLRMVPQELPKTPLSAENSPAPEELPKELSITKTPLIATLPVEKVPDLPQIIEETPRLDTVVGITEQLKAAEDETISPVTELPDAGTGAYEQPAQTAAIKSTEIQPEQSAPAAAVRIAENLALSEPQQLQTEALITVLPEVIQESIVDYIEMAQPEEVRVIEKLVVTISTAADRLHELAVEDKLGGEEARQIEDLIIGRCQELGTKLGVEIDEETRASIIAGIQAESFRVFDTETQLPDLDEGTHERKFGDWRFVAAISDELHYMLGKFAVQQVS